MRFKSNASTRACVRSDDWNTKRNAWAIAICYGPSNVRRLCYPKEPNKKELGTCPSTVPPTTVPSALSLKVSCFLSNLYNLSCSWSPYPFENMVASDHTFMKKNRVVWRWGACHFLCSCRLFNAHDCILAWSHVWLSRASSCWAWLQ